MSNKTDSGLDSVAVAFFAFIGIILGTSALCLYGAWAGAFVVTKLWGWYVIPMFLATFGLKVAMLSKIHAFGFGLLMSYWSHHHRSQLVKDERGIGERIGEIIILMLYPWLILGFGWVGVVFFM